MILYVALIIFLLWKILKGTLLRPYRNQGMSWYMKTFSNQYWAANTFYKYLLEKQIECSQGALNSSDGYYRFLQFLESHTDCSSSRETEIRLYGSASDHIGTVDTLLQSGSIPYQPLQMFVKFFGSGAKGHRVWTTFYIAENIQLVCISFCYIEEAGRDTYIREIAKTFFNKDDDPNDGRDFRRMPNKPFGGGPVHRERVPSDNYKALQVI